MCSHFPSALAVAVLFLSAAAGLARAQNVPEIKKATEIGRTPARTLVPPPDVLLMLVRSTMAALNQANFTGNYSVLHDLGTPQLQAANSQAQLAIAFTKLREQHLDLSRALVLSPDLTELPTVASDGTLRLAGIYRTNPVQISFAMVFRPVDGIWRIEGLSVTAVPSVAASNAPNKAASAPRTN
jgi:hypothetical protein